MSSSSTSTSTRELYPEKAWISLCIFLAIIGLFHWGSILHSKLARRFRPRTRADEESTDSPARAGRGWSLARLPLAAVNVFRVVAFRWTLEIGTYDLRVADLFLTLAYLALLLTWTFVGDKQIGVTKLDVGIWSSRAGVLAASQFPFVTALGTKNNVVSLVTGVGYDKLNYLHRATARSCFGLLLIHVGGKIYSSSRMYMFLDTTWLRCGIMAVVSLTILLIVSLRGIRTRAYELFFYTHFVAVFIFLVGAYYHTRAINNSYWIWPSFMFWALDRLMRLARVIACNHLYCSFSRRARLQDATTELLSDGLVRLTIRRPPHFEWSPGQTAFLIAPGVSAFPLEAHPFTISTVDSAPFHPGPSDTHSVANGGAHWKQLVFLVNVRAGFTKRLGAVAARGERVKVLVDGPYGSAPDLGGYDTCIFVAGGSGVTYTLPVFLHLIEATRRGSSDCRRLVFIWVVRDAGHLHWISDALSRADALAPPWLTVSIRIFATRVVLFNEAGSVEEKGAGQDWGPSSPLPSSPLPHLPFVRLEHGRPDLGSLFRAEVRTAKGRMSISVCGSQSLTRSVRRASRFPVSGPGSVLSGGPSVTLYEESFGYA